MNEEEIAANLAQKTETPTEPDSRVPDKPEAAAKVQPESGIEPEAPEDPMAAYYNKQQMLDYFGIVPHSADALQAGQVIDDVMLYAKREAGSNDIADMIQIIRETERMLGTPLKPNRLAKLQQFITIRNQTRLLQEKERALYG